MSVLFAGGDIGGVKAMIPVIEYLGKKSRPFFILDNGYLKSWNENAYKRVSPDKVDGNFFLENGIKLYVYTSSVKDEVPLRLARLASESGVKVLFLLDSWMNYKSRIVLDGKVLLPEKYLLMDDRARCAAIDDGIPENIIEVSGQPALAGLFNEYDKWLAENSRKSSGRDHKKTLVFVSEPVSSDHGKTEADKSFRGYTERDVLDGLFGRLQDFADSFRVSIAPHPREDVSALERLVESLKGKLEVSFVPSGTGRSALFASDAVAGISSILLYEAWLIGKPVISIQPGLRNPQLAILGKREGAWNVFNDKAWETNFEPWLNEVRNADMKKPVPARGDNLIHKNAAEKIGRLVLELLEEPSKT